MIRATVRALWSAVAGRAFVAPEPPPPHPDRNDRTWAMNAGRYSSPIHHVDRSAPRLRWTRWQLPPNHGRRCG